MSGKLYRRSEQALFSRVGDDIVALQVDRGRCYGMENVTVEVWNLLTVPRDLASICNELTRLYEVSSEQCRLEVTSLLNQFRQEGLIEEFDS